MPATRSPHNHRFDTPNIDLCTVNDFEALCKLKISISWNERLSITLIVRARCRCGCFRTCLAKSRFTGSVEMACRSADKHKKILVIC